MMPQPTAARDRAVTVSHVNYGKSPDGERWHRLAGGVTLCRQGRGGGRISDDWDLLDRLPPRHHEFCAVCFPQHAPAPDSPAVLTPRWNLDRFLEDL